MDKAVQEKLEAVLRHVKDPESDLPIGDLGIVERFRYNEEESTIYVFTTYNSHRPGCLTCVGISMAIESTLNRLIEEDLKSRFPDYKIEFVPAE